MSKYATTVLTRVSRGRILTLLMVLAAQYWLHPLSVYPRAHEIELQRKDLAREFIGLISAKFGSVDVTGCGGVDDTRILMSAIAEAKAGAVVIRNGQTCAAGDINIPNLRVDRGGLVKVIAGRTLTISGQLDAGDYQVFSNADGGKVLFTGAMNEYYPRWFAGSDAASRINALITAMPAAGGTINARSITGSSVNTTIVINKPAIHLIFGSGTWISTANPMISVTSSFATIEGSGPFATQLFVNSATNNGITVTGPISGFHAKAFSLPCHSNANTRTAGAAITIKTVGDYSLTDLFITDPWIGLNLDHAYTGFISNVSIGGTLPGQSIDTGVLLDQNSISNVFNHVGVASTQPFRAGFYIGTEVDTAVFDGCGVQSGASAGAAFGFRIHQSGGTFPPRWIRITNSFVEPERSAGIGILVDEGEDIEIANVLSTWGLYGLRVTSNKVRNLQIHGGTFGLARRNGISLEAGKDILIEGATVTENSQEAANGFAGIATKADGVRIQNSRIGSSLLSIYQAVANGNRQGPGILVEGGDNLLITGNDLRSNARAGLSYAGGPTRIIQNNLGVETPNQEP